MTTFVLGEFYYYITSPTECTVGNNSDSIVPNAPVAGREFVGIANIPQTVSYNAVTYNVTAIGPNAFKYCSKMTGINIPSTIKTLSWDMIYQTSIKHFFIPASVETIQSSAFSHTYHLQTIQFEMTSKIKSILFASFASAYSLKYLILPPSVEKIETNAFHHDHDLKLIVYCGYQNLAQGSQNLFQGVTHDVPIFVTKYYPYGKFFGYNVRVMEHECITSIIPLLFKKTRCMQCKQRQKHFLLYIMVIIF